MRSSLASMQPCYILLVLTVLFAYQSQDFSELMYAVYIGTYACSNLPLVSVVNPHHNLLLILATTFVNINDLVMFINVHLQQEPINCCAVLVQNGCNCK